MFTWSSNLKHKAMNSASPLPLSTQHIPTLKQCEILTYQDEMWFCKPKDLGRVVSLSAGKEIEGR